MYMDLILGFRGSSHLQPRGITTAFLHSELLVLLSTQTAWPSTSNNRPSGS